MSDPLDSVKGQQHADKKLSKTWLINLSDQVTEVHSAFAAFVNNTPLHNKLEDQAKDLRRARISGSQSPQDIHATIRDLVTAIRR